jgi:hypothetical protein
MLIKDSPGCESVLAVRYRTDPEAVTAGEVGVFTLADAVFRALKVVDVLGDSETAVLRKGENQAIENLPLGGAFSGLPMNYQRGKAGEG